MLKIDLVDVSSRLYCISYQYTLKAYQLDIMVTLSITGGVYTLFDLATYHLIVTLLCWKNVFQCQLR